VSDGFDVDPTAMREHAGRLDNLAGQIGPAVDAAHSMTLHPDAYGLPGVLLLPIIGQMQEHALETVSACRDAVTATADAVRGHAGTYEELEKLVRAGFDAMMKDRS
jgi:hypothetical protein